MNPSTEFLHYLENMATVEGWFGRSDALAIAECLSIQTSEGIGGGIAEIGVHHGKSFLALACAAQPNDTLYAIDIFDQQELNVDRSGCGNRRAFMANLGRFAPQARVETLAMSSAELRGRESELLKPLRFLSIDGGHTRALTLNDLEIADAILVPGGMCCVDDILQHEWTGVLSGVFAFFERSNTLVPFALLPKKLYFCRPQYAEQRREKFRTAFKASLSKKGVEFGPYTIDVLLRW